MIRRATPEDAEEIARVHLAAFHHAYAEILAPEQLAQVTLEERLAMWQGHLGDATVWVEELDGRIFGFASVRGDFLQTLYVDPMAQAAGVGTRLLAAAEEAGARELEVFEAATQARGFYAARGWRDAGEGGGYRDRPTRRYEKG